MNINKYIGKFLLKNKYCSLPGLGVFDLKKEGARINKADETISPPHYKITFTPIGSIDDTFASFVATAENVSISNASNSIRDYCKNVKDELAKSGKYDIEYLGRFTISGTKIAFQQSDDLDMGAEPAPLSPLVEKTKSHEETILKPDYSYPPARPQRETPVLRILIPVILLGLLSAGTYFGYDYYKKNKTTSELSTPLVLPQEVDTLATVVDSATIGASDTAQIMSDSSIHVDSGMNATSSTPLPPVSNTQSGASFNVAILSYITEEKATIKANKLKSYGNNASVVNSNGQYVVVINATCLPSDTTRLVDSLRRFFNPKGPVYIMK